jgi:hypothetical protein
MYVRVKQTGRIYKVPAIDFEGIVIRKGEPSVIIVENDGCLLLKDVEILKDEKGQK